MISKQQFINALKGNLRILIIKESESLLSADFNAAAEFVYDNFVNRDIASWTAEDFIVFIKKTHGLLAQTLYFGRNTLPGDFRKDMLLVLRHNAQANYESSHFAPKIIGGAILFMLQYEYSNEIIRQFAVAYHKFFHTLNPDPLHYNRSKDVQEKTSLFLQQRLGLSLLDADFYDDNGKELPLTEQDKVALNYIYRIYPDWEAVNNLMKEFASKILAILGTPNEDIDAIFFYEFLQIKPFIDGNGRMARLMANAIRAKQDRSILNLNTLEVRKTCEYSIYLENDCTESSIIELFKKIAPSITTVLKAPAANAPSMAGLIHSLGHISTSLEDPFTTKQDIMNCFGDAFWKKYGAKIHWKHTPYNESPAIGLRGVTIKATHKAWFEKKLAATKIQYAWIKEADGNLQLVFSHIDKASFDVAREGLAMSQQVAKQSFTPG